MADEDISESFSEWQQIPSPSPSSPTVNNNDTQFSKEDLPINDTQIAATEITTLPLTEGTDNNNDGIHEKSEGNKWFIKKNLRELSSWIVKFASKIRNYAARFTANRSRILAVLLVSLFYWMIQEKWRRQRQIDTSKKLMLLIQEKDQKIDQLSLQISQMNDSLVAQRNVPVLRVG
ncbi:uncharacterized protein LOC132615571 [Lycium barbarum]|uniref:uncharacterized protein LOC132615571 n=1 Tax=Lycium barbarum TaxID=112863 RepID=UPI00293E7E22|nr:uncharacterized protein LOC132615571 [Lycium barbarum]XP_060186162.1 uncharacterized protein LOC132615571 [Lycium barbarum]